MTLDETSSREAVITHPFLHGMSLEHQQIISESAHVVSFKPDQIIFYEGKPANELFLIQTGKIALEAHELGERTALVDVLEPGDVLGWSWLIPPFAWHLQARAIEPTTVIALNGARLLIHAEQDHDFGYELMKRVSRILMHRLEAARRKILNQPRELSCLA